MQGYQVISMYALQEVGVTLSCIGRPAIPGWCLPACLQVPLHRTPGEQWACV